MQGGLSHDQRRVRCGSPVSGPAHYHAHVGGAIPGRRDPISGGKP